MKLWGTNAGVSPRRVLVYAAEKGIVLETAPLDLMAGEHKRPEWLARNPAGKVPVLELDDGSFLSESAAIIEYLEEIYPEPPMIGATPEARAHVRALDRIVSEAIAVGGIWLHHTHPRFAARHTQEPKAAEVAKRGFDALLQTLEGHMGGHHFLAGDAPTIADCSLFAFLIVCEKVLEMPIDLRATPGLAAWYARFSRRPSAAL